MVEEDGLAKPHFKCYHCGRVIKEASSANFCWDPGKEDNVVVVCKEYACEKRQENKQGGMFWMEADVAILFLIRNSGIDLEWAREKAKCLAMIG